MKSLKGTKTEANLKEAFAGESQARNKYTFFASKAEKEGYNQIADFFNKTAANEKIHAKLWFKLLNDGEIDDTLSNLEAAAEGENSEWTDMYPRMAKEAREEGFEEIASLFEKVGEIEKSHEESYKKLCKDLEDGKIFKKDEETIWECSKCGYRAIGNEAPDVCPVCGHPVAYFYSK